MKTISILFAAIIWLLPQSLAAQGIPAPFTSRLQTVFTGFSRPVLIRGAGDGSKRLFILQQAGVIRVVQPGSVTPTDFINLSSKITIPVGGGDERGLLGLAFHPQFGSNGKFYVNYTRVGDGATIIAEYRTAAGDPNQGDIATERILLTIPQPFTNHNGGMISFGPADGYLYIGMGDGGSGNDPGNRAQNRAQLLGKMLRIDVNVPTGSSVQYFIPPTNPFTGAGTVRCDNGSTTAGNTCQEIWSIGMRNPWRWSFDRGGTNQLYAGDVGQNAVEEIDIITGGANYGWRVYEGSMCTNLDPSLCTNPNPFTFPIIEYSSADSSGRCSVTGGFVYRGTQGALPVGGYVFADYCSGEIWLNNLSTRLHDTPRLIVSFGEDDDGELYVCYSNGQIDKLVRAKASADVDGDLKTDFAVFRPSQGAWYAINSSNSSIRSQQFGVNGDIPTPEDFDGDNITDIGVFRPSNGVWYYFRSSDSTWGGGPFGLTGDVPVAGDYDGDTRADVAVFRPSTGVWYILRSSTAMVSATRFGVNGDQVTPGDYDGDGKYDIAVWRPSDGNWYRLNSSNNAFAVVRFGFSGDIPAQGDFDADGRIDHAVFRPSTGTWYILRSLTGSFQATQWGVSGDIPVTGDYDGDARDDVAVYRPSSGSWYVLRSTDGGFVGMRFGVAEDLPVPSYDNP